MNIKELIKETIAAWIRYGLIPKTLLQIVINVLGDENLMEESGLSNDSIDLNKQLFDGLKRAYKALDKMEQI